MKRRQIAAKILQPGAGVELQSNFELPNRPKRTFFCRGKKTGILIVWEKRCFPPTRSFSLSLSPRRRQRHRINFCIFEGRFLGNKNTFLENRGKADPGRSGPPKIDLGPTLGYAHASGEIFRTPAKPPHFRGAERCVPAPPPCGTSARKQVMPTPQPWCFTGWKTKGKLAARWTFIGGQKD